jgi:membrane fusion protein (multidrug efflux system)
MNKRSLTIIVTVIAFLLLLMYLKPKPTGTSEGQKKPGGKPNAQPTLVAVMVVQPQTLNNTIQVAGSVLANEEVELRPESNGKVIQISMEEGAAVKKGSLLMKINDSDLQAQLLKLNYQLKLAQENEGRQKKLLAIQALSQQEYDVAMNQLNTLRADVDLVKVQIAKTEIRAPFDGMVGLKYVSEGSFVTSSTKIATLQDLDRLKIDFSIPEQYMRFIHKNDSVVFTVPGGSQEHVGKVFAIEPKIDPGTRTVQVRAVYPNSDHKVYPGSFASVKLIMEKIPDALMIPTQAVIPQLKGQKVFICKNGKAAPRNIEVSTRTEDQIRVTKGLSSGDSLITTGIMQLKPDAPVKFLIRK